MKKTAYIYFAALLFAVSPIFAQEKDNISSEETINYINGKLKGIAQLTNERGTLVIEFFKNEKVNRVDRVPIVKLNPDNVEYIADEKALVLRCIADECIDRRIEIPKTKGYFSRISFAGDFDGKSQKGLVKAFEHLIMIYREKKYRNNTPFEQ